MTKRYIELYDTTLRDGTQGEKLSFTVEDKLRIAKRLDALGLDFIEAGWPGSNPKDEEFFKAARTLRLKRAKLAAFGSTRRASNSAAKDANLRALVAAKTPVITIFGKSWDFHVKSALHVSLQENLTLIADSIAYLKKHAPLVFYDAEHFFDGFKANPEYALATLDAAYRAGADRLVLCETNGGVLFHEVDEIVRTVTQIFPQAKLGIHCHNDAEVGVANSLTAIRAGAVQVHGTINGYGERCGNANLCSIIPAIALKLDLDCGARKTLHELTDTATFVREMANLPPKSEQPYVGESAFAHKGGIHVSAVLKNPLTYEHIAPEAVGNTRRVLISDLSGESNLLFKAKSLGLRVKKGDPRLRNLLMHLKELENVGYQFEAAEASFEILLRKTLTRWHNFFELDHFRVTDFITHANAHDPSQATSEATVKLKVGGVLSLSSAEGVGPVNALDTALRKALLKEYPSLKTLVLNDYKVRVLSTKGGTSSVVRVLIEFSDRKSTWRTVGVSPNIIQASYQALVEGIEYKLFRELKPKHRTS